MDLTNYITTKSGLITKPEVTDVHLKLGYQMFNDAGVEAEVGEFLYSFTRLIKPEMVLETGTHEGISTAYMALALKKNNSGKIITMEKYPPPIKEAMRLWQALNLQDYIQCLYCHSLGYKTTIEFDLLFLDSIPEIRFDEFIKYFPLLKLGGFIIVHDLNFTLGHHGQTHHGIYDWPYGDFRKRIGSYITSGKVQTFSFATPRGLVMFQKVKE